MYKFRKNLARYEMYILLFFTNAISMIMELVAARILSPSLGSSNIVWTIIISMMLFANGVGNYLGGLLSDRFELNKLKIILLTLSGLSTLVIACINTSILGSFDAMFSHRERNAAFLVVALLMIPCTSIGMLSPVINKSKLDDISSIGNKSGIIYAVITAGSLAGTLLGGLVLIPAFGCNILLFSMAVCLAVFGAAYLFAEKSRGFIAAGLALNLLVTGFAVPGFFDVYDFNTEDERIITVDTDESYVRIYDYDYYIAEKDSTEKVRMFSLSGGFSSAAFRDPAKRDELVFSYTKAYNTVLEKKDHADTLCMIGGAGYSYPRYIISHYPEKTMDVIEIDGGVTEAAKKYFYLQDFIDEYGTDRLGLYTDDGRLFLANSDKKYDVIFNDAFSGHTPARSMSTRETALIIQNSLEPDGIYASNVIGNFSGYRSLFLRSEIKTLLSVFRFVWLINAEPDNASDNWILIASDTDFGFDSYDYRILEDDIVFTDDYAPVEFFTSDLV